MSDSLTEKSSELHAAIRLKPSDDLLRVHLFQLYAQEGKWQKALTQLQVAAQLSDTHEVLAQAYVLALRAESQREEVFKGVRSPKVLGEPRAWIDPLIAAMQKDAVNEHAFACDLRAKALLAAPPISGHVDEKTFEWIADSDSRIGPVLEVVMNGVYCWAPFDSIVEVKIDAPADLRDLVWIPAQLQLIHEGLQPVLLPVRYPIEEGVTESGHLESRLTSWSQPAEGTWIGHGVKIFATDSHEHSLLDCRHIRMNSHDSADH